MGQDDRMGLSIGQRGQTFVRVGRNDSARTALHAVGQETGYSGPTSRPKGPHAGPMVPKRGPGGHTKAQVRVIPRDRGVGRKAHLRANAKGNGYGHGVNLQCHKAISGRTDEVAGGPLRNEGPLRPDRRRRLPGRNVLEQPEAPGAPGTPQELRNEASQSPEGTKPINTQRSKPADSRTDGIHDRLVDSVLAKAAAKLGSKLPPCIWPWC